MKAFLVGLLAVGAASAVIPGTAQAADPYWRAHHEVEWQERGTFRGPDFEKRDWLREHCIRDWDGHEMCRR
jgi:hypothetical protein